MNDLERKLDDIDAMIFTGDALEDARNRKLIEEYTARWLRAVKARNEQLD
jgi:hypothetical protein